MNSKIRIVYTPKQVTSEQLEIQDRAMVTANLCAKILREEFDVEKVILFGSMIYPQDIKYDIDLPLELCSDIDLAIFGGKPEREFFNGYIRALVACGEVSTYAAKKYNIPEFKVDLVLANGV
ncbi:MAG: hypothetical protein QNJ72_45200 [Pleurocapsa sp. MO_226.B13]|nr:hypothetical protein [Pleurocapsa sp. MO_226.B13]